MTEVSLKIRFTQPCLGALSKAKARDRANVQGGRRPGNPSDVLTMPRGVSGQVMFPPAWWRAIVALGARVKGGSVSLANKIDWSLDVDGVTDRWTRHVPATADRKAGQACHEAFMPGAIVGVDCVLPPDLDPAVFRAWMEAGGKYKGISPYKPGEWGRFEVVEVAVLNVAAASERTEGVADVR